jgi:hypothetical protein
LAPAPAASGWVEPQRHEQLARMIAVVAHECRTDIVAEHIPDFLRAVLLMQEIVTECRSGNLRNVLVLGDGEHFRLAQIAQGQCSPQE